MVWVDAPAGASCILQKHCLIFLSAKSPVLRVDAPAGAFCNLKNPVLHVFVYTCSVLRVDAPAGAFCFLGKHPLIFLSVYKPCVMGGHSRRGFSFSSKTHCYLIFECPGDSFGIILAPFWHNVGSPAPICTPKKPEVKKGIISG